MAEVETVMLLYQRSLILTCFTGEKITIGQERFAPQCPIWGCSAPQVDRDAPNGSIAHGHEKGQYQ